MTAKNQRLRFLASRVTREVYHPNDRVVVWRGRFLGRSGVVVKSVGKKLYDMLSDPSERTQRVTTDKAVSVFKMSCCLIA
jgi:hypothetical protein